MCCLNCNFFVNFSQLFSTQFILKSFLIITWLTSNLSSSASRFKTDAGWARSFISFLRARPVSSTFASLGFVISNHVNLDFKE